MASKGQLTGITGVYFSAAELSKLGYIVTPTSRNAQGVDLLIANSDGTRTFSAQVKTNATVFSFWLLSLKSKRLVSKSLFYIFVNLRKDSIEYYIVPSVIVASKMRTSPVRISPNNGKESIWYSFYREDASIYQNKWLDSFGDPKLFNTNLEI